MPEQECEDVKAYIFPQGKGGNGIKDSWLLLDSESSIHLIKNPKLLSNIQRAPNGASMVIACNAGTARTCLVGDMKGVGVVWYYKYGIANVLSLGLLSDKFRITMDTEIDNALYVHKSRTFQRFERSSSNLYYTNMGNKREPS